MSDDERYGTQVFTSRARRRGTSLYELPSTDVSVYITSRKFARPSSKTCNSFSGQWVKEQTLFPKRCLPGRPRAQVGEVAGVASENTADVVRAYIDLRLWEAAGTPALLLHWSAVSPRASAEKGVTNQFYPDRRGGHPGQALLVANHRPSMPRFWRCWPRYSTAWAYRAGR